MRYSDFFHPGWKWVRKMLKGASLPYRSRYYDCRDGRAASFFIMTSNSMRSAFIRKYEAKPTWIIQQWSNTSPYHRLLPVALRSRDFHIRQAEASVWSRNRVNQLCKYDWSRKSNTECWMCELAGSRLHGLANMRNHGEPMNRFTRIDCRGKWESSRCSSNFNLSCLVSFTSPWTVLLQYEDSAVSREQFVRDWWMDGSTLAALLLDKLFLSTFQLMFIQKVSRTKKKWKHFCKQPRTFLALLLWKQKKEIKNY